MKKCNWRKWLKRVLVFVVMLPCILVVGYVLFELFGIIVNHHATKVQMKGLEETVIEAIGDADLKASYCETGNTSGTGNHVDMLSVVVFQTEKEQKEIETILKEEYPELDEWGIYVESIADIEKNKLENGWVPNYYERLTLPEDKRDCYLVYVCQAAPFEDNIEGH